MRAAVTFAIFAAAAAWAVALNVVASYVFQLDPLAGLRAFIPTLLLGLQSPTVLVVASAFVASLIAVAVVIRRLVAGPASSALSWSGGIQVFDWNESRTEVVLRGNLTATTTNDVAMRRTQIQHGGARLVRPQARRALRSGQTYELEIEFGPYSPSRPVRDYAFVEQRYRQQGDLRERRAHVLLSIVARWGAAGVEPRIVEFDDDTDVLLDAINAETARHAAANEAWYRQAWGTTSTSARQAEEAVEQGVTGGLPPVDGQVPNGFTRYGGFVFDKATGRPIAGVCIYAGPPAGCPGDGTPRTDARGYFAIDYPSEVQFRWNFEHPAYRGLLQQTIAGTGQRFELEHR